MTKTATEEVCGTDGCEKKVWARGLCSYHYNKMRYYERKGERDATGRTGRRERRKTVRGEKVVVPTRPFLYTLDQIASMLAISERELISLYLFLEGRSTFTRAGHHISAHNIAPPEAEPQWRVSDPELMRWFGVLGFHVERTPGLTSGS